MKIDENIEHGKIYDKNQIIRSGKVIANKCGQKLG